jgi:uncharacterized HAD superfamily protein
MSKDKGLRYNEGKTRYDLAPAYAQEQYVRVLTKGAEKYDERNWERGMKWSKVLASLERHLAAVKRGEDFDPETGLLHSAHIMCNAAFLTEYFKIYPQGDDRPHNYLADVKIGLDVDEVLTRWLDAYKKLYGFVDDHEFESWWVDYDIVSQCHNDMGDEFYSNLEPKISPKELTFDPHCYVTSRNVGSEITESWIFTHGFPCRPVFTVGLSKSKVDILREQEVDIFVDDVYKNFIEINRAGICCFLLDAPHNRRYDVGYKRIKALSEITSRL